MISLECFKLREYDSVRYLPRVFSLEFIIYPGFFPSFTHFFPWNRFWDGFSVPSFQVHVIVGLGCSYTCMWVYIRVTMPEMWIHIYPRVYSRLQHFYTMSSFMQISSTCDICFVLFCNDIWWLLLYIFCIYNIYLISFI